MLWLTHGFVQAELKHAHISLCWRKSGAFFSAACSKLYAELLQPCGRQTELKHVCILRAWHSLCQTSVQHGRISMCHTVPYLYPSVTCPQLLAGQTELKHGRISPTRLALTGSKPQPEIIAMHGGDHKELQQRQHLSVGLTSPCQQFLVLIFLAGFWDSGSSWILFSVFLVPARCPIRPSGIFAFTESSLCSFLCDS